MVFTISILVHPLTPSPPSPPHQVPFIESLTNHPFFLGSCVMLIMLFMTGIHKRIVAPSMLVLLFTPLPPYPLPSYISLLPYMLVLLFTPLPPYPPISLLPSMLVILFTPLPPISLLSSMLVLLLTLPPYPLSLSCHLC